MLIIKDVLRRHITTSPRETTVRELSRIMTEQKVGHILITDVDGKFVGIVTESDIVGKVLAADRIPYITTASDVMSSPLAVIDIDQTIYQAQELMDRKHILHLAVTEADQIVGVVTIRDLIHPYEHFEPGSSWV